MTRKRQTSALELYRGLGPFPSSILVCEQPPGDRRGASEAATDAANAMRRQVEGQFAALEARAAEAPGLLDLLAVYGGYESALCQAETYLGVSAPRSEPHFTTPNSSAS